MGRIIYISGKYLYSYINIRSESFHLDSLNIDTPPLNKWLMPINYCVFTRKAQTPDEVVCHEI